MNLYQYLRLALLALLIILCQHAWYMQYPELRAGADLYVVFLLLITAARGSLAGSLFALAGGILMDAPNGMLTAFHMIYYILPVILGSMVRSSMLVEFNLLGAIVVVALLLSKVVLQYLGYLVLNHPLPVSMMFSLNYWPMMILCVLVLASWRWLVKLIPSDQERRRISY